MLCTFRKYWGYYKVVNPLRQHAKAHYFYELYKIRLQKLLESNQVTDEVFQLCFNFNQ